MSSREEFESAYADDMKQRGRAVTEVAFWRNADDSYALPIVDRAWWAWEASRQALVVVLPDQFSADRMVSKAERYARDISLRECREAIESAGVMVKP